jgi:DNA primase
MDVPEEIKKRLDIIDFIGQYLQLKKVGVNYSAPCPFHQEKTPSFMVSPERQSFRCFGCGESGDVISFYQKIEGLDFPEALKLLGERTGVEVSFKSKEASDKEKTVRDKIFRINLLSAKFFKLTLKSKQGEEALKYLKQRGLSDDIIEKFKIGFAPDGSKLRDVFYKMRITEGDLSLAGHPERFKYRIIFPIFDTLGNIIGFSGRILESSLPGGLSPHPKYLNTPETPVFHKSRVLYGINLAKDAIRKNKRVVLVEGQMDVVLSHEAGLNEVVASSGTALTDEHLKIIRRYSQNVIFAFDEDEAGQKAALNAVCMALSQSLEVKLTIIDKYKDIGEVVEKDKKILAGIIKDALPPVEWLVKRAGQNLTARGKKQLVADALFFIRAMQDEIEKAHYISYLAKIVSVPEIAIEKTLQKIEDKTKTKKENKRESLPPQDLELDFICFVVNYPEIVDGLSLGAEIEFDNEEYGRIYKAVRACYAESGKRQKCLLDLRASFSRKLLEEIDSNSLSWDKKIKEDKEEAFQEFLSIKAKLANRGKEKVKQDYARLIAEAESGGKIEKVRSLMTKLQEELK